MEADFFIQNSIATDYRATFMAASIVESGFPLEQLRLRRLGISKGGKNIDSMVNSFSRDELVDYLDIFFRKRDLYESLPEGLFHRQPSSEERKGEQSLARSMERARREAFNARTFFQPFEMAIDRIALLAQLYEICLDKRDKHEEFVQLLTSHWTFLQELPVEKALTLVHFIAVCHRILNAERIGNLLSLFLDCKVEVEWKFETKVYRTSGDWQLGGGELGTATVVGNSVSLSVPVVEIRLVGVSSSRVELFSTENPAYKKLLRILTIFVPADAELKVRVEVAKTTDLFHLGSADAVLGYTTILA